MNAVVDDQHEKESCVFQAKHFAFFYHVGSYLVRFRLPVMQALLKRGARVTAICPEGEHMAVLESHGIEPQPFELDRRTFNPFTVQKDIRRLTELLGRLNPDALHTFTLRPNAYGGIAARRVGVPVVINSVTGLGSLFAQDMGIPGYIARIGVNMLTRHAMQSSRAVIFQNPDDRDYYLRKNICRPEQVRMIVGSGVDIKQFSPHVISEERREELRRSHAISHNDVVVTMVARLLHAKGIVEFLSAVQSLKDDAKFVLIGGPDHGNPASYDEAFVHSQVDDGALIAPGHQENIPEWLAISDMFVLPSYREGLPRTVLEAMAVGLPIVTTDVPGCRDTVEVGKNGLLVPAQDAAALAAAIGQLIHDPELRTKMGKRSREIVLERFSNEVIVGQFLALYRDLLSSL